MKNLGRLSIALLLVCCFVGLAWANRACETPDGEFNIMISPKTIVLSSPCDTITVHSNIPFGDVVDGSVKINGVDVRAAFADDCGDLVAKIGVDDLADFLTPGEDVTLTLSGSVVDDEGDETDFTVDEIITVKE